MLLTQPFVVSLSNHEPFKLQLFEFFRSPPFGKLRTGFDKLRANGKMLISTALAGERGKNIGTYSGLSFIGVYFAES